MRDPILLLPLDGKVGGCFGLSALGFGLCALCLCSYLPTYHSTKCDGMVPYIPMMLSLWRSPLLLFLTKSQASKDEEPLLIH